MAEYPLPKFHFQVEWGGTSIGFTEVSGLDVETEMIEYRHGASKEYNSTRFPGRTKFSNITLKRGTFAGDNQFFQWWQQNRFFEGVERRDLTISLLNENHEPVVTWVVKKAWALKVQSTDLKADGNEVAIESVEICHEGLEIKNG